MAILLLAFLGWAGWSRPASKPEQRTKSYEFNSSQRTTGLRKSQIQYKNRRAQVQGKAATGRHRRPAKPKKSRTESGFFMEAVR